MYISVTDRTYHPHAASMVPAAVLTLWIDADAAPRDVKDICMRASDRLALATVFVANQRLQSSRSLGFGKYGRL